MKKSTVFLKILFSSILLACLLLGCSSENTREETEKERVAEQAHKEQVSGAELLEVKKDNQRLSDENLWLQQKVNYYKKIEKGKNDDILNFATNIILSRDSLSRAAFSQIYWDNEDRYDGILWDLSTLTNANRNNSFKFELKGDVSDLKKFGRLYQKEYYLHYLWMRFDRSSDNIENMLTPKNKNFIYSLFSKGNIYNSSGLRNLVKGVLQSYTEIGHDKSLLEKLYDRADSTNVLFDETYWNLASESIKGLLSEDPPGSVSNESFRYAWVYSFWVRRHHEGNLEVVYRLIKEFDEHVSAF